MLVSNDTANELLSTYRQNPNHKNRQALIDAISGVKNYKMSNHNNQGHIKNAFRKEILNHQHFLHLDEIITTFWTAVFDYLPKAKLYGEFVNVKIPGEQPVFRKTKNNPIHYLRYHAKLAVRNYINKQYRNYIVADCEDCGNSQSVQNRQECNSCKSNRLKTRYKYATPDSNKSEHPVDLLHSPDSFEEDYEQRNSYDRLKDLISEFIDDVLTDGTRSYQIFKILTDPSASKDMCQACGGCPAAAYGFDNDECDNYNLRIANYLGINKTLVSNKVMWIRRKLAVWIAENAGEDGEDILKKIPLKYTDDQLVQIKRTPAPVAQPTL